MLPELRTSTAPSPHTQLTTRKAPGKTPWSDTREPGDDTAALSQEVPSETGTVPRMPGHATGGGTRHHCLSHLLWSRSAAERCGQESARPHLLLGSKPRPISHTTPPTVRGAGAGAAEGQRSASCRPVAAHRPEGAFETLSPRQS